MGEIPTILAAGLDGGPTVRVVALKPHLGLHGPQGVGSEYEVPSARAARLLANGLVALADLEHEASEVVFKVAEAATVKIGVPIAQPAKRKPGRPKKS